MTCRFGGSNIGVLKDMVESGFLGRLRCSPVSMLFQDFNASSSLMHTLLLRHAHSHPSCTLPPSLMHTQHPYTPTLPHAHSHFPSCTLQPHAPCGHSTSSLPYHTLPPSLSQLPLTHSHPPCHALPPSLLHTPSLSHTPTFPVTHSHPPCHTLPPPYHILPPSLSHAITSSLSHTPIPTLSHTPTLTPTLPIVHSHPPYHTLPFPPYHTLPFPPSSCLVPPPPPQVARTARVAMSTVEGKARARQSTKKQSSCWKNTGSLSKEGW